MSFFNSALSSLIWKEKKQKENQVNKKKCDWHCDSDTDNWYYNLIQNVCVCVCVCVQEQTKQITSMIFLHCLSSHNNKTKKNNQQEELFNL